MKLVVKMLDKGLFVAIGVLLAALFEEKWHWQDICLAVYGVCLGICLGIWCCRMIRMKTLYSMSEFINDAAFQMQVSLSDKKRHPDMDSEVGIFCDVFENEGNPVAIVTDLKLEDLGPLGKEFSKVKGVTEDCSISVVIETGK